MQDSDTTPPEHPVIKSPLHKPLNELTEDDISQLTREDCRRYLKEKGMRRPSWNKSQAIQQVISLKKLLEAPPASESGGRSKRHHVPPRIHNDNNSHFVPRSANVGLSRPVDDTIAIKENKSGSFGFSGDLARHTTMEFNESLLRTTDVSEMSLGQMTIFYCGKVNVYDDVPTEKAQVIMHLAASPPYLPQDALYDGTMVMQSSACQMQVVGDRTGSGSNVMLKPAPQTVTASDSCRIYGEVNKCFHEENNAPENPGSRKASVQRYLEKRKDRFKSKRKVETTSSAGLDIYYNHQLANVLNQHPNIGDTHSLPQIRPPNTPARCSSPENHTNDSAGLNGKMIQ
ncbi:hypothetical protein Leryth_025206 [Lithospermum erythrorhizon]|nr:hypothetical protein Leryth_025206 [Lithospermum erythrorhizon]